MSSYPIHAYGRNSPAAVPPYPAGGIPGPVAGPPCVPPPSPGDAVGENMAWAARAGELADWAFETVIVRGDAYVAYRRVPTSVASAVEMATIHSPLTREHLIRHFAGEGHADRIAVHVVCPTAETCKVTVVDIDAHGPDDDPEANWSFARAVARRAAGRGVLALVLDSHGKGGYHIWALHPRPIPCNESYLFGKWLVRGWADHGLRKEPESLPKSAGLTGKRYGQPIRLPGRHHTRPHWTKVWDGVTDDREAGLLRGAAAVDAILGASGRPGRVPASPLVPPDFALPGRRAASAMLARYVDPEALDRDAALAREALGHLDADYYDDYDRWLRVGMALRQLGDQGLSIWHEWSAQSPSRYEPDALDEKWATFESAADSSRTLLANRPYLTGLGTLFGWARENGWKSSRKRPESASTGRPRRWDFDVKF